MKVLYHAPRIHVFFCGNASLQAPLLGRERGGSDDHSTLARVAWYQHDSGPNFVATDFTRPIFHTPPILVAFWKGNGTPEISGKSR